MNRFEVCIEFRRWNRGRRRLVPKSRTRLLGLEREKTGTGLLRSVTFDLTTDWITN